MFFGYIMGRLTAYIADNDLLDDETCAKWRPCAGEDFDLILYKSEDKEQRQSILHEEIHAVLGRIGYHQAKVPEEIEEIIAQAISVFIDETYKIKRRKRL